MRKNFIKKGLIILLITVVNFQLGFGQQVDTFRLQNEDTTIVNAALNGFEEILNQYELSDSLQQRLILLERNRLIAQLKTNAEIERKKSRKQELNLQQRNFFIFFIASILTIAFLYFIYKNSQSKGKVNKLLERQEDALIVGEAQQKAIINSIGESLFAIDTNFRVISFNQQAKEHLKKGYDINLELDKKLFKSATISPKVKSFFEENCKKALKKELVSGECKQIFLDGTIKYFLVNFSPIENPDGTVRGCVVFSKDITNLKETELSLSSNERFFRIFFENSPIGIAYIERNKNSKKLMRCNQKLCKMLGYSQDELSQKRIGEITPKEDLPADRAAVAKAISEKSEQYYYFSKRLICKDGSIKYVNASTSILYDDKGMMEKMILKFNDISKERNAQEQLKRAQNQMLQVDKMASLGQLTAGLAHEINNPVNFIYSGVEGLKKNQDALLNIFQEYHSIQSGQEFDKKIEALKNLETKIDLPEVIEDIEELVTGIKEGAERVIGIVKSLQIFSHAGTHKLAEIDIRKGVDSTLLLLNNFLRNRITIKKEYDLDLPKIECYEGQLNQVFMNIFTNAIQAIGDNEGNILIVIKNSETNVILSIKDDGKGMNESIKSRIFDPFFTTKEIGKGTGLGLSISYRIIQKHQGKIEVESEVNKGTTFTITLPKSQG